MNYFELFEMPPSLKPDREALKKTFFRLSRQFHPDYFIQNDEDTQQTALETSAVLNKAYKTLSNGQDTIKYVLELKGLLVENEKYALPPHFLMDMLELNEEASEAKGDEGLRKEVLEKIINAEEEIYEPVQNIVEHYQEGGTSEKELLQVKEYYFKKKYLERLKEQLL